jgi:hypothetical protein
MAPADAPERPIAATPRQPPAQAGLGASDPSGREERERTQSRFSLLRDAVSKLRRLGYN